MWLRWVSRRDSASTRAMSGPSWNSPALPWKPIPRTGGLRIGTTRRGRKRILEEGGSHPLRSPLYALVSALLCVALCACAPRSRQAPDAAKKPPEERYGTDRTIVGRGCVAVTGEVPADRLRADQAARADVAKQLEAKVIQVVEDMQREDQKDGKRNHACWMAVRTQ